MGDLSSSPNEQQVKRTTDWFNGKIAKVKIALDSGPDRHTYRNLEVDKPAAAAAMIARDLIDMYPNLSDHRDALVEYLSKPKAERTLEALRGFVRRAGKDLSRYS